MLRIKVAGLSLDFNTRFPSAMEKLFAGYLDDGREQAAPVLSLEPEPWVGDVVDETGQGPEMVEFYAVSAALGDILPEYRRLQTHGVAIGYHGKSYIFSAPSGTGKSTRAFLWQKYLGEDRVSIINGDKPVLWFREDAVLACGSPWSGKEGLEKNVCVPLGGICLLHRSTANVIRRANSQEFFDFYVNQVQLPKAPDSMLSALSLIEELFAKVPVFVLENDMSEQGVKLAFTALTGLDYEECRLFRTDRTALLMK